MEEHSAAPRNEYQRRQGQFLSKVENFGRVHISLGNWRLTIGLVAAVLAWLSFWRGTLSPWWLLLPVAAFVALAVYHDRILERRRCAERAAEFYRRGIARIDGQWAGQGEKGERFQDPAHRYAADLDLFGCGSLFELLCTARTRMGEDCLAAWLLDPAGPGEIRERHDAAAELQPKLDLREDLAGLGEHVRAGVHPEPLARWADSPPLLRSRAHRALALALPLVSVVGIVVWVVTGHPALFAAAFAGSLVLSFALRHEVEASIGAMEQPAHDLALLAEVLGRFERERFSSPPLLALRKAIETNGEAASRRVARLSRLMAWLDSRDHVLVRAIDPVVLWTMNLCFAVEAWRRESGPAVPRWLTAVGEIEALSALAAYAYEHPEDVYPELVEGAPCFEGEGLAHPLLPAGAVRNDVRLEPDLRVLIVSGSNMSGKSTLLRTVGINTVLAMAGGPVRARRLLLAPVALGASIRVVDSIQTGVSRFYAEIQRIRSLVDLTSGRLPLLFLLDELLHGTNSHDRRIGSEAIVRGLVRRGAIGLVTTHDLALAHIADDPDLHASNVHFEDHLENGQIRFDYRLRPGVVQKSNALELMRAIGLEV
jgi:hypothetical protein